MNIDGYILEDEDDVFGIHVEYYQSTYKIPDLLIYEKDGKIKMIPIVEGNQDEYPI